MKPKYAVKVPMSVEDYIYVTEGKFYDTRPVLFTSRQEAEEHAEIWGPFAKVVRYREEAQ